MQYRAPEVDDRRVPHHGESVGVTDAVPVKLYRIPEAMRLPYVLVRPLARRLRTGRRHARDRRILASST